MAHLNSEFLGAETTRRIEEEQQRQIIEEEQRRRFDAQRQEKALDPEDVNEYEKALNEDDMDLANEPEWVNVAKIRRYKAVIAAENVEGDTFTKKINNVNKKINSIEDFMGSKIIYIQNKAYVSTVFGKKESMEKACEVELFEDNDFKLAPIQNRGDEEMKERTVVIRDLPLDVDRPTLKTIMGKIGEVVDIKLQISGLWYKAYVTYKDKTTVEDHFKNMWSIFYLKDLCRCAPASITRQEIEERNKNTLKLTDLPFGTTAYDLQELLDKVKGKTCFIPRTRNQYGRARYAFVTFADEATCRKILKNDILGTINDTVLHWVEESVKTCHKCGSMDHLVIDCQEKKDTDEFKQRRKGYTRVYTRYRVPNYKNMTKPTTNTTNYQQEKKPENNFNQQMLESMNMIQQSIKEMNATLTYLNQRITKIEKQVGIKTPTQISVSTSDKNENTNTTQNNVQQKQNQSDQNSNKNINNNVWSKPVNVYKNTNKPTYQTTEGNNNNNNRQQNDRKRVRIITSSSESESESSTARGKQIQKSATQEEKEINEIKTTQKKLEEQVNTISQQMAILINTLQGSNK